MPGQAFLHRLGNSSAELQTQNGLFLKPNKNEWEAGEYDLIGPNGEHFNLTLQSESAYIVGVFQRSDGNGYDFIVFIFYKSLIFSLIVSTFQYTPEKSENGRTRLYLLVDPNSNLIGEKLFVLDHNNEINAGTQIRQGAFVDIQPALISSPDYVIVYGVGCSSKRIDCTFKR